MMNDMRMLPHFSLNAWDPLGNANRSCVNREVQTVNWEAGKERAAKTSVKTGLKKAPKPWNSLARFLGVPKPGCLQFLRRSTLLHSLCGLAFALFCTLCLRSFALFLRATAFRATVFGNSRVAHEWGRFVRNSWIVSWRCREAPWRQNPKPLTKLVQPPLKGATMSGHATNREQQMLSVNDLCHPNLNRGQTRYPKEL